MHLHNFFYYFSLEGKSGGLSSTNFTFLPQTTGGQDDREELKRVLKADFSILETLLEESILRHPGLELKKTPILVDSPVAFSAGFKFAVRVKQNFLKKNNIMGLSSYATDTVSLTYRINKTSLEGKVELKTSLGHDLSLAAMEKILALPALIVSDAAQREIKNLRRVVAMDPGTDPKIVLENF